MVRRGVKAVIPENFEECYLNEKLTIEQLCHKFSVNGTTLYRWRRIKHLPLRNNGAIPKNFSTEYKRYCDGEISRNDLCLMFNISESSIKLWARKMSLPKSNRNQVVIPKNFKTAYNTYLNDEKIRLIDLAMKFNVSEMTIHRWRNKIGLPKKMAQKAVQKKDSKEEPEVQSTVQKLTNKESTFKFSLFGYEFSFTAKKKEPIESVNLSDEFPDEVEY